MPLSKQANAARMRAKRATVGGRTYERDSKRRTRAITGPGSSSRPFAGIDGEGGNVGGRHEYLLLRAGNHSLETAAPLTTAECLGFIADLPRDFCYVGYFFDYDVTMICRDMPPERVYRLVDRDCRLSSDGRYTYPLDWEDDDGNQFQVEYLPRKEFKVRRKFYEGTHDCGACSMPPDTCRFLGRCCESCRHLPRYRHTPWSIVNDVGTFFQCAFVKALEEWQVGTVAQRAMIGEGKALRAEFGEVTQEERDYNALEIELLQDLMTQFRQVCRDVGYVPARWQGPGNMASAMLSHHGVPRKRDLSIPPPLVRLANDAYYGGRFETTAVGPVYGGIYQYDINSAYPAGMVNLPCLIHAKYIHEYQPDQLTLCRVRFKATEVARLYSLPVRNKFGSISFPECGAGVYWSPELAAMRHQSFEVRDAWTIIRQCDCQPFDWLPAVYEQRLQLGKTAKGRVLKLGTNSLYGKQAQSIGAAPYANPVYAGLITALTRAALQRAAHSGPNCCEDCYMLATDAVFTGAPRDLPMAPGKRLGEWDAERHSELFIVQPGLYFTDTHDMPKTRGIPRQSAVEQRDDFFVAYARLILSGDVKASTVPVRLRQFTGLRIAAARHKPETAGVWSEVVKDISFEWVNKRDGQRTEFEVSEGVTRGNLPTLRTWPRFGGTASIPYSKDIGKMLAAMKLESLDQPDWADVSYGEGV